MTRSVLIAGATGFIGRHVVEQLTGEGRDIVILVRGGSHVPAEWKGKLSCVTLPKTPGTRLKSSLADHDIGTVINLAAYGVQPKLRDPLHMLRTNIALARELVLVAAEHEAVLVMTGTCAEYHQPDPGTPVTETALLETEKLYGMSKAAGGLVAHAAACTEKVPFRLLRLFNIYGPYEAPHRLLPTLVSARKTGRRVALSAGHQVRDFVHVRDAVIGILRAEQRLQCGEIEPCGISNLCTGVGTSVRQFAEVAGDLLELEPDQLGFGDLPLRTDDVPWLVGDIAKMEIDLGWQPTYDVRQGLMAALGSMS